MAGFRQLLTSRPPGKAPTCRTMLRNPLTLSIVQAALAGHVAVLDWWTCSCADSVAASHDLRAALETRAARYFTQEAVLKSMRKALVSASSAGHINVLEWWTRHGARRRDFRGRLVAAAKNGQIAGPPCMVEPQRPRRRVAAAHCCSTCSPTAARLSSDAW
ncbi:hypothetical protein DFJ73DRAFT_967479 [Zopfochytrium polystomum]|nr:hypothetical protein DFJ73DRAFT_967479 [Zopfochytrium polystomum]